MDPSREWILVRGFLSKRSIFPGSAWVEAGLNLLFPPRCAGCGRPGTIWCPSCQLDLVELRPPLCRSCGAELTRRDAPCSDCLSLPAGLEVRSAARYEGPLVRALIQLKYRPDRRLAILFAGWLAAALPTHAWRADLVAAVPLGLEREQVRGYNQAALLARALSQRLKLNYAPDALIRIRETRSQVGLQPELRRANVEAAFQARERIVAGQRILLIDDLYTTGATLSACARALQAAGAGGVYGLTVARAGRGKLAIVQSKEAP